jgi:putative serine protease PepD
MSAAGVRRGGRAAAIAPAVPALLGGAVVAGLLAVSGNLGRPAATNTIIREIPPRTTGRAAVLDVGAIYARDATGVVDITARGATDPTRPPGSTSTTNTGTGFILGTAGRIVTAEHVVTGATSITVQLQDGAIRTAAVLGTDDATDLAVLRIDTSGLTLQPLRFGRSAALRVGDPVAAIGDPFGYRRSLSAGLVSALDRTIAGGNGFAMAHVIQTDAPLNPGNSGGPLLDAQGAVVGIVQKIATSGSADQGSGVGFAVPSDIVAGEVGALAQGRRVTHTNLGASTADAAAGGALIEFIMPDGPAAQAGLRTGDVVTALDGTAIRSTGDLVAAVAARRSGHSVVVTVRRAARALRLTVMLDAQPAALMGE